MCVCEFSVQSGEKSKARSQEAIEKDTRTYEGLTVAGGLASSSRSSAAIRWWSGTRWDCTGEKIMMTKMQQRRKRKGKIKRDREGRGWETGEQE